MLEIGTFLLSAGCLTTSHNWAGAMKQENEQRPFSAPETLSVTIPAELLAALDRFRMVQDASMTRDQALLAALRAWAQSKGLFPTAGDGDEGLRPDELNATNDD